MAPVDTMDNTAAHHVAFFVFLALFVAESPFPSSPPPANSSLLILNSQSPPPHDLRLQFNDMGLIGMIPQMEF